MAEVQGVWDLCPSRSSLYLNFTSCAARLSMSFLSIELDEEIPACRNCGSKPRLICKMSDPRSGKTVRIFICPCGEVSKSFRDTLQRDQLVQRQFG